MKLLVLVFLCGLSALGQEIVQGMFAHYRLGPDGTPQGMATFEVSRFSLPPPVVNAPYSGEEIKERTQILANGAQTQPVAGWQQKLWRDSRGRVRTELRLGPHPNDSGVPVIVQISDPLEGSVCILDTINRVAHRVHVDARPESAVATSSIRPTSTPTDHSTEQLGTKMIDGIWVSGTRTTRIIPESPGNDRPTTTTTETWISNELHLPILTVASNPLIGTMTIKFASLSTSEPAPSLFIVPPGYSVVDAKESFTIRWGDQ